MDNTNITTCISDPHQMHSVGLWGGDHLFNYPVPTLELQILVIFILTQLIHYPLMKFRFPKILAQIIVGVLLGPTMPDIVKKVTYKLFPFESQQTIATLSMFGYTFLLFLTGVKSDVSMVRKSGNKAFALGFLTLIVPLLMGSTVIAILGEHDKKLPTVEFNAVVPIYCLTPLSGIAISLKDLKLLNTELGRLALSAGVVSEFLNVSLILAFTTYRLYLDTNSLGTIVLDLGLIIVFLLIVFSVIRPMMILIVKHTPEGRNVRNEYLYIAVLLALGGCLFTHMIDQYVMLGAFLIGLAIPDGPPLGSSLIFYLDSFISGLIVPLFVTITASRVDFKLIFWYKYSSTFAMIIVAIFLTKLAVGLIPAWFCNVPFRDATALGLIMCTKGIVELTSASISRDKQIANEVMLALIITTIAGQAVVTTIFVRKLYDPRRKYAGYQSRNIMHTKMDAELRIVACLHRADNTNGFINFFEASGPTKDSPMEIYALNLIELHGRSIPIFISHQLQKRSSSGYSYSEDILLSFIQFERRMEGAVSVQCFTAISPRKIMHEDICTLALDKMASLIIIPFHRRWDVHGSIVDEDNGLRMLNQRILDRSPCSIGLLVDRGLIARESSYSVAMIFIGGKDDREALMYAKRIVKNSSINLTVIHVVAEEDPSVINKRERLLDMELLRDIKENNVGTEFVFYIEEKVNDGPETALIVRNMVSDYDLIIVGRGDNIERPQTSGLSEWSEFPELGIMGDYLGSIEGKCRASILVIQQQKKKT